MEIIMGRKQSFHGRDKKFVQNFGEESSHLDVNGNRL
jgi:hypothetical protein